MRKLSCSKLNPSWNTFDQGDLINSLKCISIILTFHLNISQRKLLNIDKLFRFRSSSPPTLCRLGSCSWWLCVWCLLICSTRQRKYHKKLLEILAAHISCKPNIWDSKEKLFNLSSLVGGLNANIFTKLNTHLLWWIILNASDEIAWY